MKEAVRQSDLTDAFEAHRIDNSTFRHKQHLQVAFELLGKYDFVEATSIYAQGIRTIATKAGAPQKFNTTVTFAFMSLIAERLKEFTGDDFEAFLEGNSDLMSKDILENWYAPEQLFSDTARDIFPMPRAIVL
ncbi:MAG: hypothetical protein ACR2O0_05070 [Rhizobiaceae bacterium]